MNSYQKLVIILFIFSPIFSSAQDQATQLIQTLEAHSYPVNTLVYSPDGKYFASGAGIPHGKGKGQVILWDAKTGKQLRKYAVPLNLVMDLTFSPDSKYLLSVGGKLYYKNIHMWDVHTGKYERSFLGHSAVSAVTFTRRGKHLFTGGLDGKVKFWDAESGEVLQTFSHHKEPITEIVASPVGGYFASSGANYQNPRGEIVAWGIDKTYMYQGKLPGIYSPVNSLSFSADGKFLASASKDGTIAIWDMTNGKEIYKIQEPDNITKVRFSPQGNFLATASSQGVLKIWDIEYKKELANYQAHNQEIRDLAYSPNGQYIISGGLDKTVKIWKALPNSILVEIYVKDKMAEWQQKSKYEKTQDYQARMQVENQAKQVQIFAQEALNAMAQKNIYWKISESNYDADNETFQLKVDNLAPFYLKVPVSEAPSFDEQINHLVISEQNFSLNEKGEFVLIHLSIQNPANGKTYLYDSKKYFTFNPQNFEIKVNPIEFEKPSFVIPSPQAQVSTTPTITGLKISEVDQNLPKTRMANPDAIAVVIGNSQYQKIKPVNYAINDARSIRKYLIEVLGFKPGNIIYQENASLADFKLTFGVKGNAQGKLFNLVKPNKSEVFIFYSGHGAPGLKDKKAYFVPVECDPQYVELTGYSAEIFYNNLAQIPAKSMVVALDACFSGPNIYDNISPIYIKSKGALALSNGALLASSQPDQVSTWYNEKEHGMFTYFFLKAIHQKNGDLNRDNRLTLQEIYEYMADNTEGLPYYARSLHGIEQTPVLKGQNPDKVLVTYE